MADEAALPTAPGPATLPSGERGADGKVGGFGGADQGMLCRLLADVWRQMDDAQTAAWAPLLDDDADD